MDLTRRHTLGLLLGLGAVAATGACGDPTAVPFVPAPTAARFTLDPDRALAEQVAGRESLRAWLADTLVALGIDGSVAPVETTEPSTGFRSAIWGRLTGANVTLVVGPRRLVVGDKVVSDRLVAEALAELDTEAETAWIIGPGAAFSRGDWAALQKEQRAAVGTTAAYTTDSEAAVYPSEDQLVRAACLRGGATPADDVTHAAARAFAELFKPPKP